jgi:hypothetical protein
MMMQTKAMITFMKKMECLFPVIGCPWTFCNSVSSGILLGPMDRGNQDITIRARKPKHIVQKKTLKDHRSPAGIQQ